MNRRQMLMALGAPVGPGPRTRLRVPMVVSKGDPAGIEATIDGKPTNVQRLKGPSSDLVVLLVLDFSGDTVFPEAARAAMETAIGQLPANVWIAVLRSQDGLRVLLDPSGDHPAIIAAIHAYSGGGKTGLLETVEDAAKLGDRLLEKSVARVAVVFCTDGNIHNYREDFTNPVINSSDSRDLSRRFPDQLIREKVQKVTDGLLGTETPLWLIHVHDRVDSINDAYQRGLQQLAEATGGSATICRGLSEIPEGVAEVFAQVREHWSVIVALPAGQGRSAVVSLSAPDCEMTYRQRFSVRR